MFDLMVIAEKLASEIKNSNIFLTGATGFIGKWLLETVSQANEHFSANINVVSLSRNPECFLHQFSQYAKRNDLKFIKGDITSFDFVDCGIDYIIHSATPIELKVGDEVLESIVIDGTQRVLNFATQSKIKSFLYISSGGVYGHQVNNPVKLSENLIPTPQNIYGKLKLEAEKLCLQSDVPTVIVRPFAFLGPYLPLDAHFAAGNFINDVLQSKKMIINSDGSALSSYMYPSDLCEWLFAALIDGKNGDVFNIGSDRPVSILELAKQINAYMGRDDFDIIVEGNADSVIPPSCYIPDVSKIKSALGVDMKISLDEAIAKTINFYKHDTK